MRGHLGLQVGRRGDVHGVRRVDEALRVEVGPGGGLEGLVGPEAGQRSRGGRPDAAQLPRIGGDDAVQQVAGQAGGPVPAPRPGPAGPAAPVDGPPRSRGCACRPVQCGGVQEGCQQCLGPLGPVDSPTSRVSDRGRPDDQRPCHGQRTGPGRQVWSGDHRSGVSAPSAGHRPGRIEQEGPPTRDRATTVASRTSGLVDVETTGPLAASTLGMTRRRRLSRPRRTEDHHRMLGWNEAPTVS